MTDPAVSLCVPTCDGAAFLAEALESARTQSFTDLELLVVDDASRDGSAELAASCGDARLRLLRNPVRLGLPGNWNRCLAEARGRYVQLLFQDDRLERDALARLVAALEARPEAALAFGRRSIRYEAGVPEDFPLRRAPYREAVAAFERSLSGPCTGLDIVAGALEARRSLTINVVGEPSFALLRRSALAQAGAFDPRFRQLADWDLWLRLADVGPLVPVAGDVGVFRVHPGAASLALLTPASLARENAELLRRVAGRYGPRLPLAARWRLRAERLAWQRRQLLASLRAALGRRPAAQALRGGLQ